MKYFSSLISHFSSQKGFSLVELLVTMTVFAILTTIVTLNLHTAQQNTNLVTTIDTLLTDLSQQQVKAMVGDTEGRATVDNYGIRIGGSNYTLFYGIYNSSETTNFSVSIPSTQQITTTFPSNQIIFLKGSGEVSCFVNLTCAVGTNTITVRNTISNEQRIIKINRYGVVTGVN